MTSQRTRDEVIADLIRPGQPFEVSSAHVDGAAMLVYRNTPATLRDVLTASEAFSDREFLVYEATRWTYHQHRVLVAELAAYLTRVLGIGKGDRVAIAMRNYPEWSVAFWATQSIGAIAVPLNAWWSESELAFAVDDSGSTVLVADSERLTRLQPRLAGLRLKRVIVVRHGEDTLSEGLDRWEDICTGSGSSGLPEVRLLPDDPSTIVYTSGTTGTPKGAVHLHRNHCTSVMNNLLAVEIGRQMAPQSETNRVANQSASLLTFPLFHIAGLVNLYLPMSLGSKVVLLHRWDVDRAVELIIDEGITSTVVVPTVLRELLDSSRLQAAGGAALTAVAAGGAVVPATLVRKIGEGFDHRIAPANGYGLTETTAGVISTSGADYMAHPDSIGRPFPVVEVRIVSPDDRACDDDEIGELWVRGPNVVPGYWNNPTATAEAFTDGWFHTGDLGRRDAEGRYYIADRLKDVVIRGGENVYCAEVETVLLEHPSVADVAVIGMPHERLGEEVLAIVRWREHDADADEQRQSLIAFAQSQLAYFKVPSRVVEWPVQLPRTTSGKVLKRDLREQLVRAEADDDAI